MEEKRKVNRWHKTASYLPEPIATKVKSRFEGKEFDRVMILFARLVNSYDKADLELNEPKEIPSAYINKILTGDHAYLWPDVLELGLIKKHTNYGVNIKRCNSFVFSDEVAISKRIRVEYKTTKKKRTPLEKSVNEIFDKSVTFELPAEPLELAELRREMFRRSIAKRMNFDKRMYKPKKGKKKYIKVDIDLNEFISSKAEHSVFTLAQNLENLKNGRWRASRNKTNSRLDTNFTNLNKEYLKYIRIDGGPVKSIDLSNSQFTIFSNLLYSIIYNDSIYLDINIPLLNSFYSICKMFIVSKGIEATEDVKDFCEAAISGQLYEEMGKILRVPRTKAKEMAFELFFGSSAFGDKKAKAEIRKKYPTIVEIIDHFKDECTEQDRKLSISKPHWFKREYCSQSYLQTGYKKFSVMLQHLESHIFIDEIYIPLLDSGHTLISVHDSFLYNDDAAEDAVREGLDIWLPFGYNVDIKLLEP